MTTEEMFLYLCVHPFSKVRKEEKDKGRDYGVHLRLVGQNHKAGVDWDLGFFSKTGIDLSLRSSSLRLSEFRLGHLGFSQQNQEMVKRFVMLFSFTR